MAKKINKEEAIKDLRKWHDEIKENPYWINFEDKLLKDLLPVFRKMANNVWGVSDNTNPFYVILRCITHDFNAMLSSIPYWMKDHEFKEHKENTIIVLQAFLMNVHSIIDGREPDENTCGYTYNGNGLKTYRVEFDKDKNEFFAVNIIRRKNIPALRIWLSNRANLKHTSKLTEWCKECLEELDKGEQIIGRTWKILDK